MNNERRATGSGFKLNPGSKEKHSEGTFRMDSPMKQLGFAAPMGPGASPMRQNGPGDKKKKKTIIKGKEYAESNRRPGETGQQFYDRVQREKKYGKKPVRKPYKQSAKGKAMYAKMSSAEKRQRLKDAEARKKNRLAKLLEEKANKKRSARAAKGHDVNYANRSFRKNTSEGKAISRDIKKFRTHRR